MGKFLHPGNSFCSRYDDLDEREQEQRKICSAIYYSISDPTRDVVWPARKGGRLEEKRRKRRRRKRGRLKGDAAVARPRISEKRIRSDRYRAKQVKFVDFG